jgi:hypothetical protein
MGTTSDRNDPRLTHGADTEPVPQAEVYLVLSDEERAKGFVRPVRRSYVHVGPPGPTHELRPLTDHEESTFNVADPECGNSECAGHRRYVAFEPYEEFLGRFWTQEQLNNIGKGCGDVTRMAQDIAETYARDPHFYGATYCVRCRRHLPVGKDGEFVWLDDPNQRVGT